MMSKCQSGSLNTAIETNIMIPIPLVSVLDQRPIRALIVVAVDLDEERMRFGERSRERVRVVRHVIDVLDDVLAVEALESADEDLRDVDFAVLRPFLDVLGELLELLHRVVAGTRVRLAIGLLIFEESVQLGSDLVEGVFPLVVVGWDARFLVGGHSSRD